MTRSKNTKKYIFSHSFHCRFDWNGLFSSFNFSNLFGLSDVLENRMHERWIDSKCFLDLSFSLSTFRLSFNFNFPFCSRNRSQLIVCIIQIANSRVVHNVKWCSPASKYNYSMWYTTMIRFSSLSERRIFFLYFHRIFDDLRLFDGY